MESPYQRFLLRVKVAQVKQGHALGYCPAHADKSAPSLSIREGRDGRVLLKCFAGCDATEIVSVLDMKMRELYPWTPGMAAPKQKPRATQKTLKDAYQTALKSILDQRPPQESDAPVSTAEINRARAITAFKFSDVELAPRAPKDWEIHQPWDRDPLWPTWFGETLRDIMLMRWARENPDARPGESDPNGPTALDRAQAADRAASEIKAWVLTTPRTSTPNQ
jgi:hypothetical protein